MLRTLPKISLSLFEITCVFFRSSSFCLAAAFFLAVALCVFAASFFDPEPCMDLALYFRFFSSVFSETCFI